MHKHYYFRLAKDNIKKNPRMYIPYLITSMLTSAMLYIILSLSYNFGSMGRGQGRGRMGGMPGGGRGGRGGGMPMGGGPMMGGGRPPMM